MKTFLGFLILMVFLVSCDNSTNNSENPPIGLVINEFMVKNLSYPDCEGKFGDWVELYNRGKDPIKLSDFYISDNPKKPLKYQFTDTTILPGAFYVIWGGKTDSNCIHKNHCGFSLSSVDTSEVILLSYKGGQQLDKVEYFAIPEALISDSSYGRITDGSDSWAKQSVPTIGQPNN